MKTPSVRLPDNVHRAVKNSKYSIGDLARAGIEAAVISEFESVCWICGAGIHQKERSEQIDRNLLRDHIAGDSNTNWRLANLPMNLEDHQRLQDHIEGQVNGENEIETYYQLATDWLAVPDDRPVDICTDCLDILDSIKDRRVRLEELPVPYLFRKPKDRDEAISDPTGARENPMVAYATDATAVALADYRSFLRPEKDEEEQEEVQKQEVEEVFWWAARNRHKTVKYGVNIWRETAVRSHAHRLGWDNEPLPVFKFAVENAPLIEELNSRQLTHQRPALSGREKEILDKIQEGEYCSGCGDEVGGIGSSYCHSCLFVQSLDGLVSHDCDEPLVPFIDGALRRENVMVRCSEPECGEIEEVGDEYVEAFMKRYQPVFEAIEYTIPLDIPDNLR